MDPYLAEIRLFAGNFQPLSYQFCAGQSMSIAVNTALYALIGTTYGGDGIQTFNLPDLRGRVPVGTFTGPGLPPIDLGEVGGVEEYTLTSANMPIHTHMLVGAGAAPITGTITATMNVSTATGSGTPEGSFLGADVSGLYANAATGTDTLNSAAVSVNTSGLGVNLNAIQIGATGGSQPVNNLQPFLVLNYIIAVEGIFPSRN